jgi:hypothetical protein
LWGVQDNSAEIVIESKTNCLDEGIWKDKPQRVKAP